MMSSNLCKTEIIDDSEIIHASKEQQKEETGPNLECKTALKTKTPQMSLDQLPTCGRGSIMLRTLYVPPITMCIIDIIK